MARLTFMILAALAARASALRSVGAEARPGASTPRSAASTARPGAGTDAPSEAATAAVKQAIDQEATALTTALKQDGLDANAKEAIIAEHAKKYTNNVASAKKEDCINQRIVAEITRLNDKETYAALHEEVKTLVKKFIQECAAIDDLDEAHKKLYKEHAALAGNCCYWTLIISLVVVTLAALAVVVMCCCCADNEAASSV